METLNLILSHGMPLAALLGLVYWICLLPRTKQIRVEYLVYTPPTRDVFEVEFRHLGCAE